MATHLQTSTIPVFAVSRARGGVRISEPYTLTLTQFEGLRTRLRPELGSVDCEALTVASLRPSNLSSSEKGTNPR